MRFVALYAGAAVQGNLGLVLRGLQQNLVQMGAVDGEIGQAITLVQRLPQCYAAQTFAAGGSAHMQRLWAAGLRLNSGQQAPLLQNP